MDFMQDVYGQNQSLWHFVMAALIFGGIGRIAFWRDYDGLRVGGMLATGLAMLLTIALLTWAAENHRQISEFGPWAAALVGWAIIITALNAHRKSRDI